MIFPSLFTADFNVLPACCHHTCHLACHLVQWRHHLRRQMIISDHGQLMFTIFLLCSVLAVSWFKSFFQKLDLTVGCRDKTSDSSIFSAGCVCVCVNRSNNCRPEVINGVFNTSKCDYKTCCAREWIITSILAFFLIFYMLCRLIFLLTVKLNIKVKQT